MEKGNRRQILFLVDGFGPLDPMMLRGQIAGQVEDWEVHRLSDQGPASVAIVAGERRQPDWFRTGQAVQMLSEKIRDVLAAPGQTEVVLYGQAPLPVFTQLGFTVSAWRDAAITLLNRRPDGTWDRIPLADLPRSDLKFFSQSKGSRPVPWPGRVAVYLSTRDAPPPVDAIQQFFERRGESPLGLITLRTKHPLTESTSRSAIGELAELFSAKIPAVFPRQKGLALFINGPATLAYLAGRAINPQVYTEVWIADYHQGEYLPAVTLPWRRNVLPPLSDEASSRQNRASVLEYLNAWLGRFSKELVVQDFEPWLNRDEIDELLRAPWLPAFCIEDSALSDLPGESRGPGFDGRLLEVLQEATSDEIARIGLIIQLFERLWPEWTSNNLREMTPAGETRVFHQVALVLGALTLWIRRMEPNQEPQQILSAWISAWLTFNEARVRSDQGIAWNERLVELPLSYLGAWLDWTMHSVRAGAVRSMDDVHRILGEKVSLTLHPLNTSREKSEDVLVHGAPPDAELVIIKGHRELRQSLHGPLANVIEMVFRSDRDEARRALETIIRSAPSLLLPWLNEREVNSIGLIHRIPGIIGSGSSLSPATTGVLSDLVIHRFRGVNGMRLEGLGRVNLLVGRNNVGKTSVLEAVYLLAAQSDVSGLIDIMQQRGRWHTAMPPSWFNSQVPAPIELSGRYAGDPVQLRLDIRHDSTQVPDATYYLATVELFAARAERRAQSATHLFAYRDRQTTPGHHRALCPVLFSTPFALDPAELLNSCNEASIRRGSKEQVLTFIREHVDPGLKDIAMVGDHRRFMVSHEDPDRNGLDLTALGDGVQRIFRIGLLFAAAAGGLVLVDEVDNAVHTELLIDFTRLLQDLAVALDVQVFLTTHSRECIDAFVHHQPLLADLVAYALVCRKDGVLEARRFPGERLDRLISSAGIDVRTLP